MRRVSSAKTNSDDPIEPYEPFLLDGNSEAQPVMLGLRAVVNRKAYEYKIEFERTRFVFESLKELLQDVAGRLMARGAPSSPMASSSNWAERVV